MQRQQSQGETIQQSQHRFNPHDGPSNNPERWKSGTLDSIQSIATGRQSQLRPPTTATRYEFNAKSQGREVRKECNQLCPLRLRAFASLR
jgi:hypothetical protein